jgi:NADH:ubiquinone reductase (H+-translocating)
MANAQKPTKIVILGAGFAGVYVYKHLHEAFHKKDEVQISVIAQHNYFLFTPLLHEVATGGQARENIVEPLRSQLCCLKELYLTTATKIDPSKKIIHTKDGEVSFDYLVLATGSGTNFFGTPGGEEHSYTLKSLEDAVKLKNHVIHSFERACHQEQCEERNQQLSFVVVGGGATGVELAAELAELCCDTLAPLYPHIKHDDVKITLIQSNEDLIPQFKPKLRKKALKILQKKSIDVRLNTKVNTVAKNSVTLDSGETVPSKTIIWTAGVSPQAIPFTADVEQAKNGMYVVNQNLQLTNYENIFALGDVAAFTNPGKGRPVPTHAQTAVAEASKTAENIVRLIKKKPLKPYYYKHKGDLISLGRWRAGGTIAGITFSGRFAWWLWRTIYLFKLLSWQKKVRVAVDWTINLFSKRDIAEL